MTRSRGRRLVRSVALGVAAAIALVAGHPASSSAQQPSADTAPRRLLLPSSPTDLEVWRARFGEAWQAAHDGLIAAGDLIEGSDLTDEQKQSLRQSLRDDEQGLSGLGLDDGEVETVPRLRSLTYDARQFYPRVYATAVSYLHRATALGTRLSADEVALVALPDGYDGRAAALSATTTARRALAETGLEDVDAYHGRAHAAALTLALRRAREQVQVVDTVLAGVPGFARIRSRVTHLAHRKETRLSRVRHRVAGSGVGDGERSVLLRGVEHARQQLVDLASHASAASSYDQLLPLWPQVRDADPHVYELLLSELGQATRLHRRVLRNDLALAEVTGRDVGDGVAANEEARFEVGYAVAAIEGESAAGTVADNLSVTGWLDRARLSLLTVEDVLTVSH